ncbi:MAG: calcineurin-like phosphoesterase family protein [Bacteroidota bacterium]
MMNQNNKHLLNRSGILRDSKTSRPGKTLRLIASLAVVGTLFLLSACGPDDPDDPETGLSITGVSIPSNIDVLAGGAITITGKGFESGDQIRLTSTTDSAIEYTITVGFVTDQSATITLPPGMTTGQYKITVLRGDESQVLGSVFINITVDLNIPDKEGMTIKGVVFCNGQGVPGVVVSDGYEVTVTDDQGIYYLPSDKKYGYVFISLPGNYEVNNVENLPQFFKRLAGGSSVEQKDFSLIETDNTNHVVLTMADWHLANRNDDVTQFSNGFLPDVNATINEYEAQGTKVYGLTLGDMTWDLFWYSNHFALPEYLVQMYKINCTIFNLMGNHDNDPYCADDWLAEQAYKDIVGPTYYSFNLGSVHYVVLDNIQFLNYGASQGVVGPRNYNEIITSDQLEWLQKDLAALGDKSAPIIIGMHHQFYRKPVVDDSGNYDIRLAVDNGSSLESILEDFTSVHMLSGHTHVNYSVEASASIMEHNTAAVCATWWWTGKPGYAGNQICPDGSPGGYGVWEINGTDLQWYYKSTSYESDYQFRSYDLNTIHITAEEFAPNSTDAALAEYAGEYAGSSSANEVLINIWGWDKSWNLQVKENGNALDISRVNAKDPLHIISYEAKRLNAGADPTSSFVTQTTPHMFKVKASAPASTLEITVTDRFGNVYSEMMERPKEFTYSMR